MPHVPPRQVVHFHQRHHDAVMSGAKVATVRWQESISVGPALFVFDGHPTAAPIEGQVIAVESHHLSDLSAAAARQPEGTDMRAFGDQLRASFYPEMPTDACVDIVVIAIQRIDAAEVGPTAAVAS